MNPRSHWRAFGPEWFERHQGDLLWLLRAPLIGRWFRWCLCIRACDIGHAREILEIRPHCYTVAGDEPDTLTTDFRTHWKYSKRLYYAFRPLWWAMHWWDALIAEPFMPRLSFGFPTLTAYPDADPETTTVDGTVARVNVAGENWSSLINGVGTDAAPSSPYVGFQIKSHTSSDNWVDLYRGICLFDTALSVGKVQSAILSLYGSVANDQLSISPSINIYTSNPSSNTDLISSDYGTLGTTPLAEEKPFSSISSIAYNHFELNQDGLNQINLPGITKLSCRNANYDVAAVAPTWAASQTSSIYFESAEYTGLSRDPKLSVTYGLVNAISPPNRMRPRPFAPGIAR